VLTTEAEIIFLAVALDHSSFIMFEVSCNQKYRISMHHPDIYDILAILEDYFLLVDSEFRCKIEPVIYSKPYNFDKPEEDFRDQKGLKISRQLNHGRIEINIFGLGKDYDCIDCQYFIEGQFLAPIEIIDNIVNYDVEKTRAAIRKIIILDRDSGIKSESSKQITFAD
jgi:hypothetical protein